MSTFYTLVERLNVFFPFTSRKMKCFVPTPIISKQGQQDETYVFWLSDDSHPMWWFDWEWPPLPQMFEDLVPTWWNWAGLGGVNLLKEVCHCVYGGWSWGFKWSMVPFPECSESSLWLETRLLVFLATMPPFCHHELLPPETISSIKCLLHQLFWSSWCFILS